MIIKKLLLPLVVVGLVVVLGLSIQTDDPPNPAEAGASDTTRVSRQDTASVTPHISFVIHQSAINDLLAAIGDLEGDGSVLFRSGLTKYAWKVEQPRLTIADTGAVFVADVSVKGFGMDYTTEGLGKAHIEYDHANDQINLVLETIIVEIRTKILGKEIKLGELDIAAFYDPKVKILGPLPLQTDFNVKKQDEKKPIHFAITDHKVRYEKRQVTIDFEVNFSEGKELAKK